MQKNIASKILPLNVGSFIGKTEKKRFFKIQYSIRCKIIEIKKNKNLFRSYEKNFTPRGCTSKFSTLITVKKVIYLYSMINFI